MRMIALAVMLVGVAVGGAAAYHAWKFVAAGQLNAVRPEVHVARILVAKQRLAPGDRIGTGQIGWAEWPAASVPAGAFGQVEVLLGEKGDVLRVATRTIEPGEPILDSKVSEPGGRNFLEAMLPPDMRAFSIPIDSVSGVSGFVNPGDRVDILLIHGVEGGLVSRVILTDVTILATDQNTNTEMPGARLARTVTVAVTTQDAQRLSLAMGMGRLSLMLRGLGEAPATEPAAPVDSRNLDGLSPPGPAAAREVRVRRGTVVESVPVQ